MIKRGILKTSISEPKIDLKKKPTSSRTQNIECTVPAVKSLGFFPGLNLENQSFWAKISLLTTSILVTVVTLVFSVASSNLFSVYIAFS